MGAAAQIYNERVLSNGFALMLLVLMAMVQKGGVLLHPKREKGY